MERKPRRKESIISNAGGSSRVENEGGSSKGKLSQEILFAYNTYLQAKCLHKLREESMEKVKADIKRKEQKLEEEKARLKALRQRRIEIQYLAETLKWLDHLEEILQFELKMYPPNILEELFQIKNYLQHNLNQLPVRGAIVAGDESEQIMKILPNVKQTLEKFQNSVGDQGDLYEEVAAVCTVLANSIARIITTQKRFNDMIEEITSLGLRMSALNILKVRSEKSEDLN